MFNFFKKFKLKRTFDGFYSGDLFIEEFKVALESGSSITHTCSLLDYVIEFKHEIYTYTANILGVSTISYKKIVICKENHNLSLSSLKPDEYLKHYFKRAIGYAQQLDVSHLNVVLPFFETKAFNFTRSLESGLSSTHPHGCVYNVALMQDAAPYNDYLNRNCNKGWTKFKIITYDDTVFNCLYTNEFGYLQRQNQIQISQIETISGQISLLLDNSTLTLDDYERTTDKVFFNTDKKTALLYRVIKSQKDYHGSHMDEFDELYNFISLHLFWVIDFENKTTKLNIFVCEYDDNTLIKEYTHSMETKFKDELLDLAYYEGFFMKIIDQLIHCYYPSRKLVELLANEISLDDFDGTLTEDQYYVFKMMNI